MQWNGRSLLAHQAELKNYLACTKVRPSLICVQETSLKTGKNVTVQGYSIERRDREGANGGGVAILIADGVSYTVVDRPQDVEALSIQFSLASKRKITVTNIYHPPGTPINTASLQRIFALKDNIIVGDFNSHSTLWGSTRTDANGRVIEELLEEHDLTVLNTGEGTFVKPNSEGYSPLDLTIVPIDLSLRARWEVMLDTLGSDHLPVITTIDQAPALQAHEPPKWDLKRADWALFSRELEALSPVQGDVTTQGEYERLVGVIFDAAGKAISKKSAQLRHKPLPYWNEACQQAIKLRNMARNRWKAYARKHGEGDEEFARLKGKYQEQQGRSQWTIKDASRQHWQAYCSTLSSSSKLGPVWRMARTMNGISARTSMPSLVTTVNGVKVVHESNEEKANLLAQTYTDVRSISKYEEQFRSHKDVMKAKWSAEAPPTPGNDNAAALDEPIGWHELRMAVERSKSHSSPGPDTISYEMV